MQFVPTIDSTLSRIAPALCALPGNSFQAVKKPRIFWRDIVGHNLRWQPSPGLQPPRMFSVRDISTGVQPLFSGKFPLTTLGRLASRPVERQLCKVPRDWNRPDLENITTLVSQSCGVGCDYCFQPYSTLIGKDHSSECGEFMAEMPGSARELPPSVEPKLSRPQRPNSLFVQHHPA